ncbi:Helix-turn-helix domain-containing protein [Butyrivibrio hungatei]|uniref:Helix-turn-helix domain-containing protein n=1 Tax=Butyrivibrio hungatei TaxID=185008 RepID=A0A1G5GLE2_9FIRM|nr:helix-turn-helix domain-containing protein [Butyrivibrio hungatei]SCY52211.1 Helix-turn-helix domain-containing protein [Butyrivibrio hungatei]
MEYANMLTEYSDVLSINDIMKILKIGKNTVYGYLKTGTIKSMMIAGKYRVPKLYLLEFMYPDVKFVKEAG